MHKKHMPIIIMVLLAFLFAGLVGCQGMLPAASGVKDISQMTPKEKSTWMLGVYNSQYADHRTQTGWQLDTNGNWVKVSNPELSNDKREILQQKKDLLKRMYPLIKIYDGYIEKGVVPSRDTEQQIIDIINRLESL